MVHQPVKPEWWRTERLIISITKLNDRAIWARLFSCQIRTPLFTSGVRTVQVYSLKSQKHKPSEAAHCRYVSYGKCVNAPHSLQLCPGPRYINVMSVNHLLCIVLYFQALWPLSCGSSLVSSELLSYKNIIQCGRTCFDITDSQIVNYLFIYLFELFLLQSWWRAFLQW